MNEYRRYEVTIKKYKNMWQFIVNDEFWDKYDDYCFFDEYGEFVEKAFHDVDERTYEELSDVIVMCKGFSLTGTTKYAVFTDGTYGKAVRAERIA